MKEWMDQWSKITRERIEALGFPSVTAFVREHSTLDLVELAAMLSRINGDTSAKCLLYLMRNEARATNTMNEFARISLARSVRRSLPRGWGVDEGPGSHESAHFKQTSVLVAWTAELERSDEAEANRVFTELCSFPPPRSWIPVNDEDPLLLRAFEGRTFGAGATITPLGL